MWRWPRGGPIGRPAKACAVVASPCDRPVSRAVASGAGRSGVRATAPREASPEQTAVRWECSDAARSAERQDRLPPTQTRAPRGSRRGCGRDIVRGGEGGWEGAPAGGCSGPARRSRARSGAIHACPRACPPACPPVCSQVCPRPCPRVWLSPVPPLSPGPGPGCFCVGCEHTSAMRRSHLGGREDTVEGPRGRPVPWSLPSSRKAGRRVSCPSQCRLHRSAGKS